MRACVCVGEGYWLGQNSPVMSRFQRERERERARPKERTDALVELRYNNNPDLSRRLDGEDKDGTGGIIDILSAAVFILAERRASSSNQRQAQRRDAGSGDARRGSRRCVCVSLSASLDRLFPGHATRSRRQLPSFLLSFVHFAAAAAAPSRVPGRLQVRRRCREAVMSA